MLAEGEFAQICGLHRSELNGTQGLIVSARHGPADRLTLLSYPSRQRWAVRRENLEPCAKPLDVWVCCRCSRDYWSWQTHSTYGGWERVSKKQFACPSCSGCAQATAGAGQASASATAGAGYASAEATAGAGYASASATTGAGYTSAEATAGADQASAASARAYVNAGRASAEGLAEGALAPPSLPAAQSQPERMPTHVAQRVNDLAYALEAAFSDPKSRPMWMDQATDENLRKAGYAWIEEGRETDVDWGNYAGSVLMLAMIDPLRYTAPNSFRLTIFGEDYLSEVGSGAPRSGRGPDNRRTNAIEAVINYLQRWDYIEPLRENVLETWRLVRLSIACIGGVSIFPHESARRAMFCDDEKLPCGRTMFCGAFTDVEVENYEMVLMNLDDAARQSLKSLPTGDVSRRTISDCVKLSKNSTTVSLLQVALNNCGALPAHGGNLRILFFSCERAAALPPDAVRFRANLDNEGSMLQWLQHRRVDLVTRAERFNAWKQLNMEFHPDKKGACTTTAERRAVAVRCEFIRFVKSWFVGS